MVQASSWVTIYDLTSGSLPCNLINARLSSDGRSAPDDQLGNLGTLDIVWTGVYKQSLFNIMRCKPLPEKIQTNYHLIDYKTWYVVENINCFNSSNKSCLYFYLSNFVHVHVANAQAYADFRIEYVYSTYDNLIQKY